VVDGAVAEEVSVEGAVAEGGADLAEGEFLGGCGEVV